MSLFKSLGVLLLATEALAMDALPSLGKRKYLLDAKNPERPSRIQNIDKPASELDDPTNVSVMKDPIPLGSQPRVSAGKASQNAVPRVAASSKMKFEKVAVGGRYAVPRVSFEKERRAIGPVDEPVKQDYPKKVQESEQILKDLNW